MPQLTPITLGVVLTPQIAMERGLVLLVGHDYFDTPFRLYVGRSAHAMEFVATINHFVSLMAQVPQVEDTASQTAVQITIP